MKQILITAAFVVTASSALATDSNPYWWERFVCPIVDETAPGGSRETAISFNLDNLFQELDEVVDTYEYFDEEKFAESKRFQNEELWPNCAWVRINGYFRVSKYRNFEGQIHPDTTAFYAEGPNIVGRKHPHFWIENWNDKSNRWVLNAHEIEIVGRVYDQCVALLQYDFSRKEYGFRFGGACHYGENTGMILTDVSVHKVLTNERIYARDPNLRDVLDGSSITELRLRMPPDSQLGTSTLTPTNNPDPAIIQAARNWVAANQSDPETFFSLLMGDSIDTYSAELLSRIKRRHTGLNSRFAYLRELASFMVIKPQDAIFSVFQTEWAKTNEQEIYYACIALTGRPNWPVTAEDADTIVDDFVCVEISDNVSSGEYEW